MYVLTNFMLFHISTCELITGTMKCFFLYCYLFGIALPIMERSTDVVVFLFHVASITLKSDSVDMKNVKKRRSDWNDIDKESSWQNRIKILVSFD